MSTLSEQGKKTNSKFSMKIWKRPCSKLGSSDGGERMSLDEGENCPGVGKHTTTTRITEQCGTQGRKAHKCCLQLEGPRQ